MRIPRQPKVSCVQPIAKILVCLLCIHYCLGVIGSNSLYLEHTSLSFESREYQSGERLA